MSTTATAGHVVMEKNPIAVMDKVDRKESGSNYKGFVAGVFSGVSKLTGKFLFCCAD